MKNNCKIFLCFSLFIFHFSFIVAQNEWLWGKAGIGDGDVFSIATDGTGNCYISGFLPVNTIQFGTRALANNNNNDGDYEVFLVKYDANGNALWAKQTLNINHNDTAVTGAPCSISLDGAGNIYTNSNFPDSLVIGKDSLIANIRSSASFTTYLAKYDPNGNVIWAKEAQLGNDSSIIAGEWVSSDINGNVYITGGFNDTILFGSQIIASANSNQTYAFLAKFDSSGNVKWAKQSSGHTFYGSTSLCVADDNYGNSVITGYFEDSVVFGSYKLGSNILSQTDGDFFITKYDSMGNVLWAKQAIISSKNSGCKGWALTTDLTGNIYVAGDFTDTISLDFITLFGTEYTNIFLAKYGPNGNLIWVKTSKGLANNDWGVCSISIDNSKHIYLSGGGGRGNCKIAFGTDTLSINDTTRYDAASIILKFDSNGNVLCSSIIQGGACVWNYISSDTSGQFVYFGATTNSIMFFGNDTIDPFSIPTKPNFQFNLFPFVARWEECDKTLGVNNIVANKGEVKVYPNPNNGIFTIALKNVNELPRVEIYNVLGEEIYQVKLNFSNTQINIGSQPEGIYFYRVLRESGELAGSGKLIIEK